VSLTAEKFAVMRFFFWVLKTFGYLPWLLVELWSSTDSRLVETLIRS